MNSLFEVFDRAKTVLRAGPASRVRCLRHADLTFELRSGEQIGVVLNLSSAHRVTGRVDETPSASMPAVGTVTVMPPHHTFSFQVVGQCRVVALQFSAAEFVGNTGTCNPACWDRSLRPRVNIDDPVLTHLIFTTAAASTQTAQQQGLAAIANRLLAAEFLALAGTSQGPARGGLPPARLRRVLQKLEARLDAPISLASMADEAGMSAYHFARAFAVSTGWPPHRFVLRQRIHRAVELLGDQTLSVGDVAESLGFVHHSHLARTMRRFIGLTPDTLRSRLLA